MYLLSSVPSHWMTLRPVSWRSTLFPRLETGSWLPVCVYKMKLMSRVGLLYCIVSYCVVWCCIATKKNVHAHSTKSYWPRSKISLSARLNWGFEYFRCRTCWAKKGEKVGERCFACINLVLALSRFLRNAPLYSLLHFCSYNLRTPARMHARTRANNHLRTYHYC
mgnify:CR=1 FL=1